jgi:hypothetical protein
MDIHNITISGVTTSLQTTVASTNITFLRGSTSGSINDATGAVSIIDGSSLSTFKGQVQAQEFRAVSTVSTNNYTVSTDFGAGYLVGLGAGYNSGATNKGVNIGYNNNLDYGFIGVLLQWNARVRTAQTHL